MNICVNVAAFELQKQIIELTHVKGCALGHPPANSILVDTDEDPKLTIGVVADDSIDCYVLEDATLTAAELEIAIDSSKQVFRDFDNFKKYFNESVANDAVIRSNAHFSDELNIPDGDGTEFLDSITKSASDDAAELVDDGNPPDDQ